MATEINAGRVAMVPKGEWSASTAYVRLDVVQYNGSSYVASQDSTGQNPSTATNYWQLLARGVNPSNYYTKTETNTKLGSKQDALVSGQNIKTVNNESLLGSGNVDIVGKSAYQSYVDTTTDVPVKTEAEWVASLKGEDGVDLGEVAIADNLTTNDATKVLSAKQGYILGQKINDVDNVPTAGSEKFVKSGGVYNSIINAVNSEKERAELAEQVLQDNLDNIKEETLEENREMVNSIMENYVPVEITGDVNNAADEEDLTSVNVEGTDVLKFKDKVYNPLVYSGLGRKILRKNIVNGVNTLTKSMINDTNTIYVIQYDFTLGEDITVPANCVLEFEGGSISGEHTLTSVNTGIVAQGVTIFNTDVVLDGTWNLSKLDIRWFGAKDAGNFTVENNTVSGAFDSSNAIQAALNCSATGYDSVYIPSGRFYITKTLYNRRQKNIEFEGHSNDAPLITYKTNPSQCGVIFTDKDIDVLVIDKEINYSWKRGLYIKGGCIDTSICIPYTHTVILFTDNNNPGVLWNVNIDTTINNYFNYYNTDGTAIEFNYSNGGEIYLVTINSRINGLKYGIKDSFENGSVGTDLKFFGQMTCVQGIHLTSFSHSEIRGTFQCVGIPNNTYAQCYIKAQYSYINAIFWDAGITSGTNPTNPYIIEYDESVQKAMVGENVKLLDHYMDLIKNNVVILQNDNAFNSFGNIRNNTVYSYSKVENILLDDGSFTYDFSSSVDAGDVPHASINNLSNIFSSKKTDYEAVNFTNNAFQNKDNVWVKFRIVFNTATQLNLFGFILSSGYSYFCSFKEANIVFLNSGGTEIGNYTLNTDVHGLSGGYLPWFKLLPQSVSVKTIEFTLSKLITPSKEDRHYALIGSIFARMEGNPSYTKYITSDGQGLKKVKKDDGTVVADFSLPALSSNIPNSEDCFNGYGYYDSVNNVERYWNGTRWTNALGFAATKVAGSGINRPKGVAAGGPLVYATDNGFCYYDLTLGKPIYVTYIDETTGDVQWKESDGCIAGIARSGMLNAAPDVSAWIYDGFLYFLKENNRTIPIFAVTGSYHPTWVEADGAKAGVKRTGTFAQKPSSADIYVGFKYFCTDKQTVEGATDGIEIIYKGNNVWVDALGRVVS